MRAGAAVEPPVQRGRRPALHDMLSWGIDGLEVCSTRARQAIDLGEIVGSLIGPFLDWMRNLSHDAFRTCEKNRLGDCRLGQGEAWGQTRKEEMANHMWGQTSGGGTSDGLSNATPSFAGHLHSPQSTRADKHT